MLREPESQTGEAGNLDPITTEVLRNAFISVTEDMKTALTRTAYNLIIYEALDFTVGLFTKTGETLSIGIGLPMFIRGMGVTVQRMIAHYGLDHMRAGDIYLTNDAYITGSHLNHITLAQPIVVDGEVVAFAACMAHWIDVGGAPGQMSVDIYAEGLQLPILALYRAGELNEDLVEIIKMNVRFADTAMGDLRAQVGAVRTGEKRILDLIERYGKAIIMGSVAEIFRLSEAAARSAICAIPDGVYEAESFLDDDGVAVGVPIPVRVRVVVENDEMTIDLSGTSPQVRGFFNSGEAAGRSAAQVAFKCIIAPTELPINDGCFRPLKVVLPEGTVVSAQKPAPMAWWMTYPMTVIDTVFKALAQAIPERVIAGHYADLAASLIQARTTGGNVIFYPPGLPGGGWGAKHNEDGMSGMIPINDGDTHNSPIEHAEAKYPHVVEKLELRTDSGGAGRHRGGLGVDFTIRVLGDVKYTTAIERVEMRPWGLYGGLSGSGNQVAVIRKAGDEIAYPTGKLFAQPLVEGDALSIRSGGGGGFGSPLERQPENVAHDVRQGYVSVGAARELYGVVMGADGQSFDDEATGLLREQMRAANMPRNVERTSELLDDDERRRRMDLQDHANQVESALQSAGVPWMWNRCC